MKIILIIIAVALGSCHSKKQLDQNSKVEIIPLHKILSPKEKLFTLENNISENYILITPPANSDFKFPEPAFNCEPYKFADFNADSKEDVLINLGACGTGGCMYGLFLKQYDNNYKLVFIDYLKNIDFVIEKNGFWKIKSSEEVEAYNPSKLQISIFKFDKKKYEYVLDTTFVYHDKELEKTMGK